MNEENQKAILENTGLKIGIIGIGNAGSQAAMAASSFGHRVFIINTSDKDMNDAVVHSDIHGYRLGDGRGSGKDRDNAMALLKSRGKEGMIELFNNPFFGSTVNDADVVVVAFSTGGGTGSGTGPYLSKAIHKAYPTKVVIPYGILPKNSESVQAQSNTISCVDDISKIGTPYMLADLEYYADLPQEKSYANICNYIAETLNVLRGDYLSMSANGMADERDVLTVISEPGYMTVHICDEITDGQLANKSLQGYLIDQIKSSPACHIQRDSLLQYNLLITNCNSSITDSMKTGDYSELNEYVGEPKATYSNYAVDDDLAAVQLISVMSGLTIPMDRFASVKAKIKEHKDKFDKQSALNLVKAREASELHGNSATKGIIMGSQNKTGPNLNFLDDDF